MLHAFINFMTSFFTNLFPYVVVFTASLFVPTDSDLGWHLKYGEYFFQTGTVLRENIFSSMMPGFTWINSSWATDILSYLAFKNFNFWGLSILGALIITLAFYMYAKSSRLNFWEKAILFPLILYLEIPLFEVSFRGQLLTLLFLGILYYFLSQYGEGQRKFVFAIPVLFIFWSNFHGQFLFGLIIFGLWIFFYLLKQYITLNKPGNLYAILGVEKNLLLIYVLSVLATLVNPFGIAIYTEALKHFNNPLLKYIIEWLPFDRFSLLWWKLVFWDLLIIISILILKKKKLLTKNLPWCGISVITLLMSFFVRRYLWSLLLLSIPVVRTAVGNFRPQNKKYVNLISFLILIVVYGYVIILKAPGENIFAMNWDRYCYDYTGCSPQAAEFILKNNLTKNLYTFYNWGGWLIWNYPDIKPSIDGRMHLWRDAFGYSAFEEYYPYEQNLKNADSMAYDYVLITPQKPLYYGLIQLVKENKWKLLYEDKYAGVFARIK